MAGSVNKVILIGNLGSEPEVRVSQDNKKLVRLSIATSENWKDKVSGERKSKTEWHRVVIFANGLADIAEKYLKKGSKVYLEGNYRQGNLMIKLEMKNLLRRLFYNNTILLFIYSIPEEKTLTILKRC